MVKPLVVHTLTLMSAKKNNQGRVQLYNDNGETTNAEQRARPHYRLGEDELKAMSTLIMAYIGDANAISKLKANVAAYPRNVRPRYH